MSRGSVRHLFFFRKNKLFFLHNFLLKEDKPLVLEISRVRFFHVPAMVHQDLPCTLNLLLGAKDCQSPTLFIVNFISYSSMVHWRLRRQMMTSHRQTPTMVTSRSCLMPVDYCRQWNCQMDAVRRHFPAILTGKDFRCGSTVRQT